MSTHFDPETKTLYINGVPAAVVDKNAHEGLSDADKSLVREINRLKAEKLALLDEVMWCEATQSEWDEVLADYALVMKHRPNPERDEKWFAMCCNIRMYQKKLTDRLAQLRRSMASIETSLSRLRPLEG